MAKLYGLFQVSLISVPAAGWTFELRMHEFLVRKQTIQLFPVFGRKERVDILYDNYTVSKARENPANFPFVKAQRFQKNHYYCPESRNLLTIDSLLLIHPLDESLILLMFKITRNGKDHHVNPKGLHRTDNLRVPPDTHRYYVVVAPEGIHPTIKVHAKYLSGQGQHETSDKETLVSRDERVLVDEDEEVSADEGGEMSVDGNEVLVEQLFQIFHYPVRMTELFASQEIEPSIITFVLDKYSRY